MKHAHDDTRSATEQLDASTASAKHRLRRKRSGPIGFRSRIGLSLLAIFFLVLWLTPWLILKTPLRESLAQRALGDFEGSIEIGSATTGWLSPVTLNQVKLHDANGELLFEAEQIVSRRALLSLLTHLSSPGEFTVSKPSVYVVAGEDGLNWEHAIEPWLAAPESTSERPAISVVINEGTVLTRRELDQDWHTLRIPDATFEMDARTLALALKLENAATEPSASGDGSLALELSQPAAEPDATPRWAGSLKAERFDLQWASPLLERLESTSELSGQLDGEAKMDGVLETAELNTQLQQLMISDLIVKMPSLTRDRALRLDRVKIDGDFQHRDSQIVTERLELDSALAQLTANGTLDWKILGDPNFSFTDLPDLHVSGEIDLERLGDSLPGLMRLREGLTIEQGTATLVAVSRQEAGERRLFIDLNATDLRATHGERQLTWRKPLHVNFSARGRDERVWLEYFECDTEFLQFSGSGDARQGKLEGTGDLAQLKNQLEQFIDLGDIQLAGDLSGSITWAPTPQGDIPVANSEDPNQTEETIRVQSGLDVRQLQVAWPDAPEWSEALVTLQASVDVQQPRSARWNILQGTARLQTQSETAQVWLRQPFTFEANSPLQFDLEASGDLTNIIARVKPWLSGTPLNAQGDLTIKGPVTFAERTLQFDHVAADINQLRLSAPGFQLREPEIRFDLVGKLDLQQGVLDLSQSTMAGSTLAVSLTRFEQRWDEAAESTRLELAYRADAFRLMSSLEALDEVAYRPFGEITGNATLSKTRDAVSLDVTGESFPFTLGRKGVSPDGMPAQGAAYESVWTEEEISFTAQLKHRWDSERFVLRAFEVNSPSLAVNGQGFMARPAQDAFIEITGEITADLDRISQRTEFLTNQTVEFHGKTKEPFSVRGRLRDLGADGSTPAPATGLVPRTLTATLAAQFDSANLVGLETGGATVAGKLQNQVIRMEPIDLRVGEGKLSASPLFRLSGEVPVLELRDEQLLQHVALTPEVTRSWIGYTAPILASSTKAEGTFSVDLDRAAIPLTQVFSGEAKGRLIIDEASLKPGPLGVQVLSLARQIRLAVTGRAGTQSIEEMGARLPQQTIQFQLENQRMYHDQVIIQVDDLVLVTSGSIGADQSLDMVVDVRVPEAWVAGRPIAAAIANANLRVPLRGKLTAPEMDARQLLRQLGGSLLENELRRGLRDIFGGN